MRYSKATAAAAAAVGTVVDTADTDTGTVVDVEAMADIAVVTVGTFDTGHIVADRTVAVGLAIDTWLVYMAIAVVVVAVVFAVADASTSVSASLPDLQLLE